MPSGMMTSSARMTFHLPPDFAGAGAVDVAWAAVSAVSAVSGASGASGELPSYGLPLPA